MNSTGLPFNSLTAVERSHDGTRTRWNAGAIAATSLVPGDSPDVRRMFVRDGLSAFAGRPLNLDEQIYASVSTTNARNHSIARLLESYQLLYCEPSTAVDLYTRKCSARYSSPRGISGRWARRWRTAGWIRSPSSG